MRAIRKKTRKYPDKKWLRFASLLLVLFFQVWGNGVSANPDDDRKVRVSLDVRQASLNTVLQEISKQTLFDFLYDQSQIEHMKVDYLKVESQEVFDLLDKLLSRYELEYSFDNNVVVIKRKPKAKAVPRRIQGKVLDEHGVSLVGVTVLIQGTLMGTATDPDGKFALSVEQDSVTLVFSYIGMQSQTIAWTGQKELVVTLRENQTELDDVIITGYQTISKERTGGAYTVIGAKELEKKPVVNIASALNGLVPGMMIGASAEPWATVQEERNRFIIRGEGTLSSDLNDKDPLIVVDGFPIQGFDGSVGLKDPFATINPNDVASISVLKDAAATSIYGARAANGVIVITTKKGRTGQKANISVNGFVSVNSMPDLDYAYDMASTESHFWLAEHLKEYTTDYSKFYYNPYHDKTNPFVFLNAPAALVQELNLGNITQEEYDRYKNELLGYNQWERDLRNHVYRHATHQQYNLALRGGGEKNAYSFSIAYDDDKALQRGKDMTRITLNLQNTFQLYKKLSLDVSLNANVAKSSDNSVDNIDDIISPWMRLVDEEGNLIHTPVGGYNGTTMYYPILMEEYEGGTPESWQYNPIVDRDYRSNKSKRIGARLNAGLTYNILPSLSLSLKGQYENNRYTSRQLYRQGSYYVRNYMNTYSERDENTGTYVSYMPTGGIFTDTGDTYESFNVRAQANFDKAWGDRHEVTALLGTEVTSSTLDKDPENTRYGYNENTNAVLSTLDYVTQRKDIFGMETYMPYLSPGGLSTIEDRFFSVYGNVAYTYDRRYSLQASLRSDASNFQSKSTRDKFSPFWSVAAVWMLSREAFMANVDWVNLLKFRFSAGEAGVAAGKTGNSTVTTLSVSSGDIKFSNNEPYNLISKRGNPDLTWEKSRNFDVGVEFDFWNSKLSGNLTYYHRYSYDVLAGAQVPVIAQGTSQSTFNNAAILNSGFEMTLGSRMAASNGFTWNGRLNFAYNRNMLKSYHVTNTSTRPNLHEGVCLNPVWVYHLKGYSPEGYFILQGKDGKEEIVVNRQTLHYYDNINEAAGEHVFDYNWTTLLGSKTPTCNLGFTNTFTYKGLTLSVLITGKFDYYFQYSRTFSTRLGDVHYSSNLDKAIEVYQEGYQNQDYITLPLYNETNKEVFKEIWGFYSSLLREDRSSYLRGDHIRLDEVYLSYDLPKCLLAKQQVFQQVNVFVQAKNLGVIWSANGLMDPDAPRGYMKSRPMFTFGLKFNLN